MINRQESDTPAGATTMRIGVWDSLMAAGTGQCARGDYDGAVGTFEEASGILLERYPLHPGETNSEAVLKKIRVADDLDRLARAKRALGAAEEKRGNYSSAQRAALLAYDLHKQLTAQNPDRPEAHFEFGASAVALGTLALQHVIRAELAPIATPVSPLEARIDQTAAQYMKTARTAFRTAHEVDGDTTEPHRYEIDGMYRMSIAESLAGDSDDGRRLARQALRWATLAKQDRRLPERTQAVTAALLNGWAAVAVNGLIGLSLRKPAFRLAETVL